MIESPARSPISSPVASSIGSIFGGVKAYLQTLLNGFPSTITGGGQIVADYAGTLRKVNAGVPAIEGGRLATTVATGATLGAELVVNGNFASWATDNPTNWALNGTEGADNYITQVGGGARLYSTGAAIGIYQTILTIGKRYQLLVSSTVVSNGVKVGTTVGTNDITPVLPSGAYSTEFTAVGAVISFTRTGSGVDDVTFASVSVREVIPQWLDVTPDGLPLQPSRMTRTKNGTVKEYIDIPDRANSTVYALGAQVNGVATDGVRRYYTCTTAGTSHSAAPTWPTSGTVVDNDVVWTYSGYCTMNFRRYLGEPARTNLFLNSTAPVTQNITTTAQAYTVSVLGTGTVTLSGTATGEASAGSPLTVTATAGTLTCTVAGSPTKVQVEAGAFATSWIDTAGTSVTRPATVNSKSTTNVLRSQNCAVWGLVVPSAAGQGSFVNVFASYVDINNATYIYHNGTQLAVRTLVAGAGTFPVVTLAYTNTPFQYQAFWSDQGMAIRTRALTAGVWSAWSAWATNANTAAAPIAATHEIGSRNGVSQFSGNFPEFRTLFLPTKATLAEYQTYLENEANWGSPL